MDRSRPRTASSCYASPAKLPHIDRRIGDFLRREAKRDLEAASRRFARELGLAFQRVTVRDQSSRWGSCSTTGVLSFSWRLILAPSQVLDYLAAHEVAHLIEMNHSREILAAGAAASARITSAPRPGSTCMAPICIATVCPNNLLKGGGVRDI